MFWRKALGVFCVASTNRGGFKPKSIGLGNYEARMLLFVSLLQVGSWGPISHVTWAITGAKQTQWVYFILLRIILLTNPGQPSLCSPCLPMGTSWFNKCICFLCPSPEKSHIRKKISRNMFNTQNWALMLLKASSNSLHSVSVISFLVSTAWTWLWPFFPPVWENFGHVFAQVWAQEPYSSSQFRDSASSSSQ